VTNRTPIYVAVILALAAAIAFLPGGGLTARLLLWLIGILFWGTLAWFVARLYREHRNEVYGLGDRMRAVLYGSVGLSVLAVTGTSKLWQTPAGLFAWFLMIGAASYGVFAVWRHWRSGRAY
jgi:hypothetical protein